jgi:D-arabinose 1-dehydrogenase-like Zn-dependent alcohol dehydrogenase
VWQTNQPSMRAIVYDPSSPHGLRLGEAPEPQPDEQEALIEVRAIALNFADVAFLAQRRQPGEVVGFEAAGVVLEAAAGGSGPAAGARFRTSRRMGPPTCGECRSTGERARDGRFGRCSGCAGGGRDRPEGTASPRICGWPAHLSDRR